jgi:RNA polymerase sigma-70 factor (ECF subfamily)
MHAEEKQLVERAAQHDPKAFGKLYEIYSDKIYNYLYFKTMQRNEAEDLTAVVFLKAWEAIGNFRWQGYPFSTWLYRIAHNQLIDHYRTRRVVLPLDAAENREASDEPFEHVERASRLAQIREALKSLTYDQQRVVTLRYFEGYSICEIAKIMGKAPDAVRAMQHRALRGLQPRVLVGEGSLPPTRKARRNVALVA